MKKLVAIATTIILCFSLVACSGAVNSSSEENTNQSSDSTISASDKTGVEEEDNSLMTIETKYGTLSYPAKWKDSLLTLESEENNFFSVTFSTKVDDKEYSLFKVMICAEEGDSVGTIKDKDRITRNVFVDIPELSDISELSEENQNQLYAMQEGVNVLIENLEIGRASCRERV